MNYESYSIKEFHTNQANECFKSLEFVYEQLLKCEKDSYSWKWVIIGMHNAMQNCMVHAVRDSSGTSILKENIRLKCYKSFLEGEFGKVEEKLNYFLELYNDIKSDKMIRYTFSQKYPPDKDDNKNVEMLNDLRNHFIHFIPKGFGAYVYDFIEMISVANKINKFLMNSFNCSFINKSERPYTLELIDKIQTIIEQYRIELKPEEAE